VVDARVVREATPVDADEAEEERRAEDMRRLREKAERIKRKSDTGGAVRGGTRSQPARSTTADSDADVEVVGGGLVGEPIVQELYRKVEGKGERHTWVEGRGDMEMRVPIPEDLSPRDLTIAFERRWLSVDTPGFRLEGEVAGEVDVEACSWVLEPAEGGSARCVYILLVKRDASKPRWGAVFKLEVDQSQATGALEDLLGQPETDLTGLGPDDVQIHYDLPRDDKQL